MNNFTASATITPDTTAAEIHAAVLEARMTLNKRNVPVGGRILLVSPEIEMSAPHRRSQPPGPLPGFG
jgi:hypothetical protein